MVLGEIERWFLVAFLLVFLWRYHLQDGCILLDEEDGKMDTRHQ